MKEIAFVPWLVLLGLLLTIGYYYYRNIKEMEKGKPAFSNEVIDLFGISDREREIALAIFEGKTNDEIAQEKFIATTTVKKHVYNLFQKTNARNRVELVNILRNGGKSA